MKIPCNLFFVVVFFWFTFGCLFGENGVQAQKVVVAPPVALTEHCVPIIPGDPARKGTCVGAAGCIARGGYLGWIWPSPTLYFSCNNFQELTYRDCKALAVPGGNCWEEWGWSTICLTFDCYSSVGPLGTALCTPGAMVGSDSVSTDQCD